MGFVHFTFLKMLQVIYVSDSETGSKWKTNQNKSVSCKDKVLN